MTAALVAAVSTAQAAPEQTAFIDTPLPHRCRNSQQAYVKALEPDMTYSFTGFEPYHEALARYLRRVNGDNKPLAAEIACDMPKYQPTRD